MTTVTAYLADTAAPMLRARFRTDDLRHRAFGAVAELAYLAGWKHHDLGQEGAAQRYYLLGYQLACEADPHGHAAWMMRALAHQALNLKQPRHCVELTTRALQRAIGYVDGRTEALLHVSHARAHASVRDRVGTGRSLLLAEDALTRLDQPQPSFSHILGPPTAVVGSNAAKALTDLADHAGAERHRRVALDQRDRGTHKRIHGLDCADLGVSLAAQSRTDEAIEVWAQAFDLMDGVASDRTRKAMTSIRPTLVTCLKRGVPGAADLYRRVYETRH